MLLRRSTTAEAATLEVTAASRPGGVGGGVPFFPLRKKKLHEEKKYV